MGNGRQAHTPGLWLCVQRRQWSHSPGLWFPGWSTECQGAAAASPPWNVLLENLKRTRRQTDNPHMPSPALAVLNSGLALLPKPFTRLVTFLKHNSSTVAHLKVDLPRQMCPSFPHCHECLLFYVCVHTRGHTALGPLGANLLAFPWAVSLLKPWGWRGLVAASWATTR